MPDRLENVLFPERSFKALCKSGTRLDAKRSLIEGRPIELEYSTPGHEGSVTVVTRLGFTTVTTHGAVEVVDSASREDKRVTVSLEWTPLCPESRQKLNVLSKKWTAQLQQLLDSRDLIKSEVFEIDGASGAHFRLQLTVSVLEDDGSVFDASVASCIAVLKRIELPVVEIDADGSVSIAPELTEGKGIVLERMPLTVTVGSVDGVLLVDPTKAEASFLDACMTVTVDEHQRLLGEQLHQ